MHRALLTGTNLIQKHNQNELTTTQKIKCKAKSKLL